MDEWFTTPIAVTPYDGEGAYGPIYGAEQTVLMRVNEGRRLVRSRSGDEVVSETTLYGPLSAVDAFAPESLVTVDGRAAQVITVSRRREPNGGSMDHIEVVLT